MTFYFYYFTEVVHKYSEGYTNIAISRDKITGGIHPFFTLCMNPMAKSYLLEAYNISKFALNEPNPTEASMLAKLNKTIEDVFKDATFQIATDFHLHLSWRRAGLTGNQIELTEGSGNFISVRQTYNI